MPAKSAVVLSCTISIVLATMRTCFCASCGAGIRLKLSFTTFLVAGTSQLWRVLMKSFRFSMIRLRTYVRSIAGLGAVMMLVASAVGKPEMRIAEAARFLPNTIADFHAQASPQAMSDAELKSAGEDSLPVSAATRNYTNDAGSNISITIVRTERDSAAYALLTQITRNA